MRAATTPDSNTRLPRVTLIAVSYNAANLLPGFFASLRGLEYPDWQMILVDNASADGSAALARSIAPSEVLVLDAGANLGFGPACNLGTARGDGEILAFVNLDIEMPSDWLSIVAGHMQAQPDVAIACPATVRPGQAPDLRDRIEAVPKMPACAMLIWRADFEAIGGFDATIFLYWEDTDLCWRTNLRGRRVVKDHSAYVIHDRGSGGGGDAMSAQQIRNGLYVHLKLASRRRMMRFAWRMAAKTAVRLVQTRDSELLRAWSWNVRRLGETREARRTALKDASPQRRRAMELMLDEHQQYRRSAWAAIRRRPY